MFGDELLLDLMFLDDKAVLHVIDTAPHFFAATFLDAYKESHSQGMLGTWLALAMIRCLTYTGYLNQLCTDQGFVFTSER